MGDSLLLSGLMTAVIAPLLTQFAKRWQWADDLSRAVCVGVGCALGVIAGLINGASLQQLEAWALMGLAAGGAATAIVNGWKVAKEAISEPTTAPKVGGQGTK
jgi:hypothetical protein